MCLTPSANPKELDPETGKENVTTFRVKEKRIVSYNPSLAQKQKAEIMKMVDKASNYTTYKKMAREDLGDSAKYVRVINTDKNGKNARIGCNKRFDLYCKI